jgi:outer membrane protein assembly factor BamB
MSAAAPERVPSRRRYLLLGLAVVAVVAGAAGVVVTRDDAGAHPWTDQRTNPSGLASDGEVVCTSGARDDLYCLDADGGEERVAVDLDGTTTSSPTIVGDTVLLGSDQGLYAYSLDGEEVWHATMAFAGDASSPSSVPVVGDTAAAIDSAGLASPVVGVDVATGEERWEAYRSAGPSDDETVTEVSSFSDVLTDGERFYVTTETMPSYVPGETPPIGPAMTLVAIDPATGDELWQWEISSGSTSFPVATEVTLLSDASAAAFVVESGGGAGHLVVLDTATGQQRWEEPLSDDFSSIAFVDGVLVVADGTTTVGYDTDGAEVWSVPLPDGSEVGLGGLAASGDRLFLAAYDLVEIDPADGANGVVLPGVSATDAVVVGELLVVATMSGVRSIVLPAPP